MTVTDDAPATAPQQPERDTSFWRTAWRIHFYAGVFAMPVLVLLAVTGLCILYTDVINDAQYGDLHKAATTKVSSTLAEQQAAVEAAYPDWQIDVVTPPKEPGQTTTFSISTDEGETLRNVYVDPSNGEILGDQDPSAGIVGLANRLHGTINNESLTVPIPTIAGVVGDEPAFTDMAVGDLAVEIFACWGLVLAATGLYLWWPRKKGTGRALFVPRLSKKGRARWRDLHAIPGIVLSVMLVFFVATGMPWSAFWGANWSYAASEITPNESNFWEDAAPFSAIPQVGDLDRIGNRIPWATREDQIPTSGGSSGSMPGMDHGDEAMPGMDHGTEDEAAGSEVAATVSLDAVADAAADEGMLPGYSITLPSNDVDTDPAQPVYGSFVLMNPWPSDIANQKAVYLDQFSAQTISTSSAATWGKLQWATELGVQTHMGTQFGLVSRIVMTTSCLLVIWAAFSGLVMFWKRRRTGTGFPRRPIDARLQRGMIIIAVVLAFIYPLWGLSALVILLLDKYVVRKIGPLRRAFGMKDPAIPSAATPPSDTPTPVA